MNDHDRMKLLLDMIEKPRFPWGQVIVGLIGSAIGLAMIIWGMSQ